jgi:hypothetical protein
MRTRPGAGLAALLLLAACGGVSVSQDYDPAALSRFPKYRSFDWFPGGHEVQGEGQIDDPFLDRRVRAAVSANLTNRGFRKVENRTPDFYVNYHLSVRQRLSSSGINTYYGVGSYGSWGGVSVGMGSSPVRSYDEGTLVIDVIDATSRQLVWRGTGTKALRGSPTPEESSREIFEAVSEILKQFPPGVPAS